MDRQSFLEIAYLIIALMVIFGGFRSLRALLALDRRVKRIENSLRDGGRNSNSVR